MTPRKHSISSCLGALLLILSLTSWAPAQTVWYVDDDAPNDPGPGDPTVSDPDEDGSSDHPFDAIQEGIDAAVGGDEVVVLEGTYTGDGNRDLDFNGKAITVRSENGPDVTVIDCEGTYSDLHRGFRFHSGETAESVLAGLTITNGYAPNEDVSGNMRSVGGGVFCTGSGPTLENCTFSGDYAYYYGGGMFNHNNSSPTVTNCRFSAKSARSGGGMYNSYSSPTVTDCTFSANWAHDGGGVSNWDNSSPTLSVCMFSGNSAEIAGGGMSNAGGSSPMVTGCAFSGNSAYYYGGGIDNICHSSPTVTNCTFTGNSAYFGGGMLNRHSSPTVTNCTFSGNRAGWDGGGMCNYESSATVANCIFWGNTASSGPQIALVRYDDPCELTITYSDVQGGEADVYVEAGCTLVWGGGNIDADPLFTGGPGGTWTSDGAYDPATCQVTFTDNTATWIAGELAGKLVNPDTAQTLQFLIVSNTASTMTIWADWNTIDAGVSWVTAGMSYQIHDDRLSASSPCVDAGDNNAVFFPAAYTDLDGNCRIVNCTVDMGGYEHQTYQFPPDQRPALCSAILRKRHSDAGEFDVHLALTGGIKCRSGGLTQVVLLFSEPVKAIDGVPDGTEVSLSASTLESVSILDNAHPEMIIEMSGVPDQSCLVITVTGVADLTDNPLTGNNQAHITVLTGDTNRDHYTDLIDMAQVKSKNGSALFGADVRFDVNLDGSIDLIDMALIKSLNGGAVTCP